MNGNERDVLLAVIVGAHGLAGEVRVKNFASTADSLSAYGPLHDEKGRVFTLAALRPGAQGEAVLRFTEVKDRNAAEVLKGIKLFVSRAQLPATTADEFYHTDLVGLAAVDGDGRRIGKVMMVHNFGAGDVLEIAGESGAEILIAFTRENVPAVDLAAGRITVAVPNEVEAGDAQDGEGGA
jgi:16S rRNA processing protein RimM